MTTGIHWSTAQAAGRSTRPNDVGTDGDERCDLRAGEPESGRRCAYIEAIEFNVGFIVEIRHFLGHDDESIVVFLVGNCESANNPLHADGFECRDGGNKLAGVDRRKVSEDSFEVFAKCGDLLFLHFERHGPARFARLEKEGATAGLTDDAGNDRIGFQKLPGLAHDKPSFERSSPVEFTARTAGPDGE